MQHVVRDPNLVDARSLDLAQDIRREVIIENGIATTSDSSDHRRKSFQKLAERFIGRWFVIRIIANVTVAIEPESI